ncbi:MAG TPA: DUF2306 domain-containing protein [Steroidobacteraceae bacterium]|nr:DUF2306 domain-containing protein [Steroidobacteraceae bacterium]
MNATAIALTRKNNRSLIGMTLGALALIALWFIARRALPYFAMSPDHFGPYFWPRRWALVLHIAGGVIALTVGVVQLWLGLTNRVAELHRALGKTYLAAIAVGSIGGFYLALTIPGNMPYAAGLFSLCVAWVVTTAMAVWAIRHRNVRQHREWMMRSYAVTFAFVTFRFGVDALINWQGVQPGDAQATMAWACWALPLLLLEPLIQLGKLRATSA